MVGVAVLGSLVNGHLTVDLTRRLAQLGIPAGFRTVVINAVETGQVPKGSGGVAAAEKAFGPIVAHVVNAAYGAFRTGLSISLVVAGVVILVSGRSPGPRWPGAGPAEDAETRPPGRHRRAPSTRARADLPREGAAAGADRGAAPSGGAEHRLRLERSRRRLLVLEHEVDVVARVE